MISIRWVTVLPYVLLIALDAVQTSVIKQNAVSDVITGSGAGGYGGSISQPMETMSSKWFEVFSTSLSWNDAVMFCKTRRGNLATIRSQEENDLLNRMVVETLGPASQYWLWIGGTKLESTSGFLWMSDGWPFVYTNWCPGYPASGSQYNCVVNYYNGTTWGWWTYDCSYKFNALACEYL